MDEGTASIDVQPVRGRDGLSREEHRALARAWEAALGKGRQHKKDFDEAYKEARRFAYESHDFLYQGAWKNRDFRSTVPKVWEMVNIYGPMVAYRQPHRKVEPRWARREDPRLAFTKVCERLLEYHTTELPFRKHCRRWTDDSIVAGCGVMWLEQDRHTGLVGHFYDDVEHCVVDPDACDLKDAWWVARLKKMPRWEIAGLFDVSLHDPDLPRVGAASVADLEEIAPEGSTKSYALRQDLKSATNDCLWVVEVWSKMGLGWKLKDLPAPAQAGGGARLERGGSFVHFYLVPGSGRLWLPGDWPVPLWADNDWPMQWLYYRQKSNYLWPVSMIKPILGQQKALDWFVTLFLQKMKTSSRDFVAIAKDLEEDVKEKIETGVDFTVLDIDPLLLEDKRIQDLVQFLQHPPMNPDLYRVYDLLQQLFERASGLYSTMYAESGPTQSRSATESQYRESRADLRPDDMRNEVENAHTDMARRELIAARLLYEPDFVESIVGEGAGATWGEYQAADEATGAPGSLERVMREFVYRIEAGSTAKPNIDKDREDALELFDRGMQPAMAAGDFNAINGFLDLIYESRTVPEAKRVYVQPPAPAGQDPAAEQAARTEEEHTRQAAAEADAAEVERQGAQFRVQQEEQKAREAAGKAGKAEVEAAALLREMAGQGGAPAPARGLPTAVRGGRSVFGRGAP